MGQIDNLIAPRDVRGLNGKRFDNLTERLHGTPDAMALGLKQFKYPAVQALH